MSCYANVKPKPTSDGQETNGEAGGRRDEVVENVTEVIDRPIGYCRYGHGPNNFLFICGGVGCYKKDYPPTVLQAFDPSFATIVCIDPPGYGFSRPPDRQQEIHRCKKDAAYCLELMKLLTLTPFAVLGWSEGGRTAIHVAGQGGKTGLITHLVLFATSAKCDWRGDMAFKGMRNTDQWLAASKAPYLEHYSEEFLKKQWADLCDVVAQVYTNLGGNFPSDNVLPQVKCPALIINGGADRFVMDPKLMSDKLANCRVEVHSMGSHDLHIKYPKWFAMKISAFVKENPSKGTKVPASTR